MPLQVAGVTLMPEPELPERRDNLKTMALVDACYESAREHKVIHLETGIGG